MNEKIGGAKGTELDDEFILMEKVNAVLQFIIHVMLFMLHTLVNLRFVQMSSQELVLGGPDNQDAAGTEIEQGKGMERGVPLPSRLGSMGERCKLPPVGSVWSPGRKQVLLYLELQKHT